jgi:hypothetical protein
MRRLTRPADFLYGGNTASTAPAGIDTHHLRRIASRSDYRLGLGGRCCAKIVAHADKQPCKQQRNQCVIIDNEHSEDFYTSGCACTTLGRKPKPEMRSPPRLSWDIS